MLQPLGDRVVVRPEEVQSESTGGLYVGDASAEKPDRGEVVAVGPGRRLDNGEVVTVPIEVGQVVVYARGSGIEVVDGELFVVLREEEVIGIIT